MRKGGGHDETVHWYVRFLEERVDELRAQLSYAATEMRVTGNPSAAAAAAAAAAAQPRPPPHAAAPPSMGRGGAAHTPAAPTPYMRGTGERETTVRAGLRHEEAQAEALAREWERAVEAASEQQRDPALAASPLPW